MIWRPLESEFTQEGQHQQAASVRQPKRDVVLGDPTTGAQPEARIDGLEEAPKGAVSEARMAPAGARMGAAQLRASGDRAPVRWQWRSLRREGGMTNEFDVDAFEGRAAPELLQLLQARSRAVGRRRDQMRSIDAATTKRLQDPALDAILAIICLAQSQ